MFGILWSQGMKVIDIGDVSIRQRVVRDWVERFNGEWMSVVARCGWPSTVTSVEVKAQIHQRIWDNRR